MLRAICYVCEVVFGGLEGDGAYIIHCYIIAVNYQKGAAITLK